MSIVSCLTKTMTDNFLYFFITEPAFCSFRDFLSIRLMFDGYYFTISEGFVQLYF